MFKDLWKLLVFLFVAGAGLILACPSANSADFPKKPIKLIACAAAGGGEDIEARGIAPYLSRHLGVNVTVEDQPGAGGKIAFEKFMKTEPDGYSLITYTFPKSIILEYMGKVGYRTRDYTPVFVWSRMNLVLVVNADTWKTFDEFLKAAKNKVLTGGVSGIGGTSQLAGLIAVNELGIKVNWVPYEGSAGSLAALAGKHLDFTISSALSAATLMRAGKLRPLLMLSDQRDPYFPEVPIPKDLGISITIIPNTRGVQAPPNTPPSIVKILEEAFYQTVKEPEYIEWTKKSKMVLQPLSAKEFGQVVEVAYPKVEQFKEMLQGK